MRRRAHAPATAALALALALAAACLAPRPAAGDAFPCRGPVTISSACGAVFARAAGPGSLLPAAACAPCATTGCSCPPSDCLSVVSACQEAGPNGLVNVRVGLGGCKYVRVPRRGRDTRIKWVAFQGVDEKGRQFVNHAWLRDMSNTLPDTSRCANTAAGNSSTCCLQQNVQGNGQVNMFKLQCGARPVVWMGDPSFSSCNAAAAPGGPVTLPAYLFAGPDGGKNFCGAPAGVPASQVCGPYTLPAVNCTSMPKC